MRLLPIWTILCGAILLASWPAAAQMTREEIELRNQIYELQQQVQMLQQQSGNRGGSYLGGGQPAYPPPQSGGGNDLVPQLLTQVQTLEAQMRDLRGQVDELQNALRQQNADLSKRIDDMAFQMQNGGASPAAGPGGAAMPSSGPAPSGGQNPPNLSPPPGVLGGTRVPPGEPPAPPAQAAPQGRRTPEMAIQDGNAALARHDYQAAEAAARDVLSNNRTSPRAYDAQYLLAQALTGERQYAQAAIAYDDTYNRNRKGARAPEALLGLANSLTAINEKRAACDTLTKLHNEFPQAHPDIRQQAAAVGQRAGCH